MVRTSLAIVALARWARIALAGEPVTNRSCWWRSSMRPSSVTRVSVLSSTAVAANSGIAPSALMGVVASSPNNDFNTALSRNNVARR
jgi:hypothetical protein